MQRRNFFKGLLGASAIVALGEMGFGKHDADAQTFVCRNANSICKKDCFSTNCRNACVFGAFCDECVRCRSVPKPTPTPVDPCINANKACAASLGGCKSIYCPSYCKGAAATCDVCVTCFPPAEPTA